MFRLFLLKLQIQDCYPQGEDPKVFFQPSFEAFSKVFFKKMHNTSKKIEMFLKNAVYTLCNLQSDNFCIAKTNSSNIMPRLNSKYELLMRKILRSNCSKLAKNTQNNTKNNHTQGRI